MYTHVYVCIYVTLLTYECIAGLLRLACVTTMSGYVYMYTCVFFSGSWPVLDMYECTHTYMDTKSHIYIHAYAYTHSGVRKQGVCGSSYMYDCTYTYTHMHTHIQGVENTASLAADLYLICKNVHIHTWISHTYTYMDIKSHIYIQAYAYTHSGGRKQRISGSWPVFEGGWARTSPSWIPNCLMLLLGKVCIHVCMYTYIYVCMYVCMYAAEEGHPQAEYQIASCFY